MSNRIWATPFDFKAEGGTYCDAESRPLAPNKDAKLFIGADLFQSLVEELETCKKYRYAYEKCDQIATQRVRELELQLTQVRVAVLEEAAKLADAMAQTDANMNKTWRNGCASVAEGLRKMKGVE
jgi:hypothetical protein